MEKRSTVLNISTSCISSSPTMFGTNVTGSTSATPHTRLGWPFTTPYDKLILHEIVFSRADSKRRGRHRTLVADLADDINHVCCFANPNTSLPQNTKDFSDACSSFVAQAGDLGCFKCASCAKPYISKSWYRNHLSKCPKPTGAITG